MSSIRSKADFALWRNGAIRQAATIRRTDAPRVAQISSRPDAFGRKNRP